MRVMSSQDRCFYSARVGASCDAATTEEEKPAGLHPAGGTRARSCGSPVLLLLSPMSRLETWTPFLSIYLHESFMVLCSQIGFIFPRCAFFNLISAAVGADFLCCPSRSMRAPARPQCLLVLQSPPISATSKSRMRTRHTGPRSTRRTSRF